METPVVLIVDDCKIDAVLLKVVFERSGFKPLLRWTSNGDDAIAYLQGEGRYRDRTQYPLPTVVLMDLYMPRKNGFETLRWIRQQPAFDRLRVFILSGSNRQEDIEQTYELGADSYFVKPGNPAELIQMAGLVAATLKRIHAAPAPAHPVEVESALVSAAH